MAKTKMTTEEMIKKEPYRSVINLLLRYQNDSRLIGLISKGGGLMARHFRYALIKDHDEDNFEKSTFEGLKFFFKDSLDPLEGLDAIKVGCIKSKEHLNIVLKRLIRADVVKTDKRYTITRYKIDKEELFKEGEMTLILDSLKGYSRDNVFHFDLDESGYFLFGITEKLFFSLPEKDKIKIKENLIKIEEGIREINEIRMNSILKNVNYKSGEVKKENINFSVVRTYNPLSNPFEELTKKGKYIDEN